MEPSTNIHPSSPSPQEVLPSKPCECPFSSENPAVCENIFLICKRMNEIERALIEKEGKKLSKSSKGIWSKLNLFGFTSKSKKQIETNAIGNNESKTDSSRLEDGSMKPPITSENESQQTSLQSQRDDNSFDPASKDEPSTKRESNETDRVGGDDETQNDEVNRESAKNLPDSAHKNTKLEADRYEKDLKLNRSEGKDTDDQKETSKMISFPARNDESEKVNKDQTEGSQDRSKLNESGPEIQMSESFPQTPNNLQVSQVPSVSLSQSQAKLKTDSDIIQKDVRRTFQEVPHFCKNETKDLLTKLCTYIASQSSSGYSQGISFWAASIAYHTSSESTCIKIADFLWLELDLDSLYSLKSFEHHISLSKKLIKLYAPQFYKFSTKVLKSDLRILLMDWLFCLGLTKIPTEFSGLMLLCLSRHGWYYFYRVLVNYFRLFEDIHTDLVNRDKVSETHIFDFEILVKNHFKHPETGWKELLRAARTVVIDDYLIDKYLGWNKQKKFLIPGHF